MTKLNLCTIILIIVGIYNSALGQINNTFKGRIVWSAERDFSGKDDWVASPLALAIFAEAGVKDKLVHFNYNCHLSENRNENGILETARLYEYNLSNFYNCRQNVDSVAQRIADAVNASSGDNPLYIVLAGSMNVTLQGILKSDPEKRKFVYCISHNIETDYVKDELLSNNKREVISTGVTWLQITKQNKWLELEIGNERASLSEQDRKPWFWMRDSADEKVRLLWEMLQQTKFPNLSDAGMAYFLVSGDEHATLPKIKQLIDDKERLTVIRNRKQMRMEAEHFNDLKGFKVEYANEEIGHEIVSVKHASRLTFGITTAYKELNVIARNNFDISIRYYSGKFEDAEYALFINGRPQDTAWVAPETEKWQTKTFKDVLLRLGDEISIQVKSNRGSGIQFDYIDLVNVEESNSFFTTPTWPLPSPNALPGQLVIHDKNKNYPGYLAYNGVGPAFLCGPGNPEDFLWYGHDFFEDGTLKDSLQQEMIQRLADNHVNAIRMQMFRMQKSNLKNGGDDRHGLFVENDPGKGINLDVLFQWEQWITKLEKAGVAIHLEFYNEATDVEKIGWSIQADGELHPDEMRFLKTVVHRFKHHRNVIWGIQEGANILSRDKVAYFKKVAKVIADTDKYKHPIVQSFVVPNDKEGEFNANSGLPDDYLRNSNIDIITWLNVNSHGDAYEDQYQEYRNLLAIDGESFVVMKSETYQHAQSGRSSRVGMWASAMAGVHCFEANHDIYTGATETLFESGLVSTFMEQTDYQNMHPRNDLKGGETNWVLANPGESYIAYSYNCEKDLGLKQMTAGIYEILWLDTKTGETEKQYSVVVNWGNVQFEKPKGFGNEVVAYFLRKY